MNPVATEGKNSQLTLSAGIRRVFIDRLFGQYTYDLTDDELPLREAPKILLLYGDNGSGKTTILRLLFYLLSHVDKEGHKTNVSTVRFRKFLVEFADGTTVTAERPHDTVVPYELRVAKDGETLAKATYARESSIPETRQLTLLAHANEQTNELEHVRFAESYSESVERDRAHENVLRCLKDLNLGAIYVTDTRRVLTTLPGLMMRDEPDEELRALTLRAIRKAGAPDESARNTLSLTGAVNQISAWATQQAFQGSAQGEEDVNSAYAAIMKRLARAPQYATHLKSVEAVAEDLRVQGRRSVEFVRFGLMKPLNVDDIVEELLSASPQVRDSMLAVVGPYVAGLKARLDALEPIRAQLAAFVDLMNSFYRNKHVDLHAAGGLRITTNTGGELSPSLLSSGEGQLLYLFASTLMAKNRSSLFMVDEPELSLNVKWQRQLLQSLLEITADSNMQFVFATHSIELLTRYSQFVRDLNSIQEPLF